MTKTSTSTHLENSPQTLPVESAAVDVDQQNEMFYNSIKPQLNQLVKDPSDDTIEKILAYGRKG